VSSRSHALTEGEARLKRGRRALNHAKYLASIEGPSAEAEAKAREALATLRSAMDWLEGTGGFNEAHSELDRAGTFTRETFGCELHLDDDGYSVTCPVPLAHNRVGMSIGAVVKKSECSICRSDPADCDHINGEEYDGEMCHRIITEADLLEISLVGRPAQPDARIQKISVSVTELRAKLGPEWRPGMPVSCDRCIGECPGITHPFG
jgi:hypothetical protein